MLGGIGPCIITMALILRPLFYLKSCFKHSANEPTHFFVSISLATFRVVRRNSSNKRIIVRKQATQKLRDLCEKSQIEREATGYQMFYLAQHAASSNKT